MKKIYAFYLMLAMMVAFNGFAQAPLLNEGFESDDFPPAGWITNAGSEWMSLEDDEYVHGGSYCAYAQYADEGNSYLITPQLTLDGNYILRFYYTGDYTDDAYLTTFTVEISTTGTNTSDFTVLQTLGFNFEDGDYQEVEIDLSAYNSQSVYLAFHVVDEFGTGVLIDDVTVEPITGCPKPNTFTATIVSPTEVALSWNGSADSYNVDYGVTGFNHENGTIENVNENTITIDVEEGVTYDFYVQADCGDEPSVWVGPITLSTSQYVMTANGSDTITTCSMVIYDNGGADGNYSNSTNDYLVIYPQLEDGYVSITGTYNIETGSYSRWDYLQIFDGTTTEGTVLFDSHLQGSTGTISVTSPTGPVLLYFHSDYSTNYSGFELTVSCVTCMPPTGIATSGAPSTTSATLTWNGDESGDYVVTLINGTESLTYDVNGTSLDLDDLTPASFYTVYIQTVCEDGSLSIMSQAYAFHTACDLIDITDDNPWTENFDGYAGGGEQPFVCWDTPVTDAQYHGPFVYCGHYPSCHSGANSAELKGSHNMLVLPEFSNDIHMLRLSFWATTTQSSTTATVEVGVITDVTDTSTFEPVALVTNPGQRGPNSANDSHTAGWGNFMGPFDFSGVEAEGGRIALRYANTSSASASWNLDDFTVSIIPDCAGPLATSVRATNVVGHSATISWTDNDPDHDTWMVYYKPTAAGEDEWLAQSASDTTMVELTDLIPETNYQVYVVTVCGGQEGTEATQTISFRTDVACPAPSNITVSDITTETATLSWVGDSESYTVEYGPVGFTHGEGSMETAFTTTLGLTGLEPSTSYTIYIYGDCGEDGTSDTATAGFVTPCVTTVVTSEEPFMENFNTLTAGIPVCWDNSEGTTTTASYRWNYYSSGETGACVRFNSYSNYTGNTNMLKTPVLDLNALTTPMVSFSYKNPAGGDFSVFLSTDGGATYTTPIATGLTGASDWTDFEYILSDLEDASSVVVVFKGTSNYGYSGAYIDLDNVFVGEAPTCPKPTELSVTTSTANSVTLTWTAGNEEDSWDIIYGEVGFDMEEGEIIQNVTNPYEVTGLEASTEYEFYVRANCDGGDHSYWTSSVTAVTLCETTVVTSEDPFTEDFNTLTAGIPACWDNSEGTTTSASYRWNYYASGQTGACLRFDSYLNSNGKTNMLKTPVLDLSALTTPLLSFSYKNPAGGDFSVFLSTDGGTTYTTSIATGLTGVANWTEGSYVLPAMEDASSVVVVFKGTSNYEYGDAYIYLDNVFVGEAPACPKPTGLSVTATTSESVTLSWTAGNEEDSWDIIYGEAGFDLEDGVTIQGVTDNPYEITGLDGGTQYEFYVRANCGSGDVSYWTNSVTATPGAFIFPTNGETTISMCGGVIYDNGGPDGDYPLDCYATVIVNPDQPGMMVHITGTFEVEESYDYLQIYDGAGTDGTLLFDSDEDYTLDVTSTTGPLTILFSSDDMINYAGFELYVSCVEGSGPGPQPETCHAPTNVTATNITYNSAVIDWAQEGTPDSWTVNYKKASVQTWTTVNVNAHPYTITDLEAVTSYDVYVTANCDTASAVSTPISFTTLTDGVNEYVNSTVIYPNPTTGQFTISNTQCVIESVEVFDVYGKLLNTVEVNDNTAVIDVTNYTSGVYFTRIHTDKGIVTKRVVKK